MPSTPGPLRLQHVGMRGGRLEENVAFFQEILGFIFVESVGPDVTGLPFGISFFRSDALHHTIGVEVWPEGQPVKDEENKSTITFPHIAFEVADRDTLMAWRNRLLEAEGVQLVPPHQEGGDPIVFSPTHPEGNGNPGENRAFFFLDPFGNRVEFFCDMAIMTEENEIDPEWNRARMQRDGYQG